MKTNYKILAWLGLFLFIGIFTVYVFEFQWLENTLDAGELIWKSILAGVVAGIAFAWFFRKKADDLVAKIRLWAACIFIPAFFAPLLGSLTNRLLSLTPTQPETFEFWEEKPYSAELYGFIEGDKIEPDGYYLFVVRNGAIKRFKSKERRFPTAQRGESVELSVKKGLWGFEIVKLE